MLTRACRRPYLINRLFGGTSMSSGRKNLDGEKLGYLYKSRSYLTCHYRHVTRPARLVEVVILLCRKDQHMYQSELDVLETCYSARCFNGVLWGAHIKKPNSGAPK